MRGMGQWASGPESWGLSRDPPRKKKWRMCAALFVVSSVNAHINHRRFSACKWEFWLILRTEVDKIDGRWKCSASWIFWLKTDGDVCENFFSKLKLWLETDGECDSLHIDQRTLYRVSESESGQNEHLQIMVPRSSIPTIDFLADTLELPRLLSNFENDFTGLWTRMMSKIGFTNV